LVKRVSYKDIGLRYALSPFYEPALRIKPGERIIVEVQDASSGQIRHRGDVRDRSKVPYGNPVVGPIYIEGCGEGDSLAVRIEDIKPSINLGVTYFSGFTGSYFIGDHAIGFTRVEIPSAARICRIEEDLVYFSDRLAIPYRPMIGTIGTAPKPELYGMSSSLSVGPNGGNMDIPDITVGAEVYLPVFHEGGLLYIGDAHAVQGDGEISGTAVEMPAEITLTVTVLKGKSIGWPRVKLNDEIMCLVSTSPGRDLRDAIKTAFTELIRWMEEDYGIDRWEALMLLGQVGRIRVGNLWSVAAKVNVKYLKPYQKTG